MSDKDYVDEMIDKTDVKEFKLVSGESVVAEVIGYTDHAFILHNPYAVDSERSSSNAYFRKWFYTSEHKDYSIQHDFVMCSAPSSVDVKTQYIRAVLKESVEEEMGGDDYKFFSHEDDPGTFH